jgi:hypothetical protein
MKNDNKEILLLDENGTSVLMEKECEKWNPILRDFISSYIADREQPIEEWLNKKMQEQLPDTKSEEICAMTKEILLTIRTDEENQALMTKALSNGRSKESWLASTVKKSMSMMSTKEAAEYLTNLDTALQTANESLYRTIKTQSGEISQNPSLDGFIAEQYHAQTFNMNAEANGSPYRARVLEPDGTGYGKNSVDIVIVDDAGKTVKRYQAKYCKDAKATERAFESGNYRGQQKLVPEGQQDAIQKKATTVIEAPDGTTSNPLTKERAEQMRDEAQGGKWKDLNWNEYEIKNISLEIGRKAGMAALQGAAIGTGLYIAEKLYIGERLETDAVVESAILGGADFGIKAAAAGALKVGVEKRIITVIPQGTPAGMLANIAYIGIENIKVAGKVVTGELSIHEGLDKMEQTTGSVLAGLLASEKGMIIGGGLGIAFGPIGVGIGAFIGSTVGYIAGSKLGETLVRGAQKLRNAAVEKVKTIGDRIKDTAIEAGSWLMELGQNVADFFAM